MAVCKRYVALAVAAADFSQVKALAIDETSRARGHDYITLAADAVERRVLFVTEGRGAKTIERLATELDAYGCVVREMLLHWCTCDMRSKVEPMKEVAALARCHLSGIVAWAQTRQTNGFLEAINGLFQSPSVAPAASPACPPSEPSSS